MTNIEAYARDIPQMLCDFLFFFFKSKHYKFSHGISSFIISHDGETTTQHMNNFHNFFSNKSVAS